ncbi:TIGR04282 family arsenosugar biosynthesis glycosyltransferase [Salinibacter altiplanensis]|uniref:TIGR04282 family arsenosugar biosynthesis glycosyltransferase n=1 Tax=Salinibacter altiplanensis TaxID=1803181 RepID=UPI000C9FBDFE|nr:TIGR04282 family arsenosugar biosynthesis glycosyltransferase [Salinibacter altiplanensis]
MDPALLVFAKVPRPGTVKTRLTPALSAASAARLYTAFLRDTLRQVVRLEADVRLYLAPPLPDEGLDAVPSGVSVHAQTGEGLGGRMKRAFQETLAHGHGQVLVMGSDHPTLPPSFLRRAKQALRDPGSLCIGPTEDGGFYALGMSAFYPQLFDGMSYSHSRVFAETLSRAGQTEADLTVLPQWYDVDRPGDLGRLLADIEKRPAEAPNTRRVADRLELASLA